MVEYVMECIGLFAGGWKGNDVVDEDPPKRLHVMEIVMQKNRLCLGNSSLRNPQKHVFHCLDFDGHEIWSSLPVQISWGERKQIKR